MKGNTVKELATLTAGMSKRPYGRMKATWCATPTIALDVALK